MAFLLLIFLILAVSSNFSLGFYYFSSFAAIAIASLALCAYLFSKSKNSFLNLKTAGEFNNFAKLIVFILIGFSIFSKKALYDSPGILRDSQLYIFVLALAVFCIYLILKAQARLKFFLFLILIALPIVSKTIVIRASPSPKIDTFDIVQGASHDIVRGQNPYTADYTKLYGSKTPDYYTYMPFSFLIPIIPRYVFGDIRYAYILFEAITVLVILKILKRPRQETGRLLALAFLYNSSNTYTIEQAWLDPILTGSLAAFGYSYIKKPGSTLSYFLLTLALGTKQNMILLLPFAAKLKGFNLKNLLIALVPITLITAIFFMLSPSDFIKDTLIEPLLRQTRYSGMTIFSLFAAYDIFLPSFLSAVPYLLLFFFLKGANWNLSKFYLSFSAWFILSLLLYREAFLNHFYFAASLVILAIAFGISYDRTQNH